MKIDFHIHTEYSKCSNLRISELKKICEKKGIIPAITDHNTISGALEYQKKGGKCIIGEEIKTSQGEIIGLFLKENIPSGLGAAETVKRIKKQKGLVVLQHPFDRLRKKRMSVRGLREIIQYIDAVEVFNSRTIFDSDNKKAYEFAKKHNLPMVVGSDGHFAREIGKSHVITESIEREKIILEIKKGKRKTKKSSITVHIQSKLRKILR